MADPTSDLFAAALALPEAQRLHLASELLASVEELGDTEWELAEASAVALLRDAA